MASIQLPLVLVLLLSTVNVFGGYSRRSDDPEALQLAITNLASTVDNMQSQLTSQQTQINQQQLKLSAQQDQINQQQLKLSSQRERIEALEAANRRRVAFSATGVEGHNIRANGSAIIPFPHVITNVGNAYNPTTSVFTAPYDGDYFFIVNMDVSHDYEAVLLTRNGHMVIVPDKDDTVVTHLSGSVVITLKAGDDIAIHHMSRDTGYVEGGVDTTFTGFLVN